MHIIYAVFADLMISEGSGKLMRRSLRAQLDEPGEIEKPDTTTNLHNLAYITPGSHNLMILTS